MNANYQKLRDIDKLQCNIVHVMPLKKNDWYIREQKPELYLDRQESDEWSLTYDNNTAPARRGTGTFVKPAAAAGAEKDALGAAEAPPADGSRARQVSGEGTYNSNNYKREEAKDTGGIITSSEEESDDSSSSSSGGD
jgi:hypothetical protein